ncbi:TldD/PmbA family protein [candidate division TA06 bacterium]|uniref:TldD/PmbA family protein n=1 Tax=candidate division TA06 bacterium TaxID=2250710 RepID=A0A933MH50_UNCT6|nr:TldD/PmbA family protein [candidate division TA06 bacterium]
MNKIINQILDLAKKKAEAAEVILVEGKESPVEFRSGKLHSVEHKEIKGAGLRVVRHGRIGFSSTTDFDKLPALVDHAAAGAAFGQQAVFNFPAGCKPAGVKTVDPQLEKFTPAQAVAEGQKALGILAQKAPALKCDIGLNKKFYHVSLANSRGFCGEYDKTSFSYGLSGVTIINGSLTFIEQERRRGKLDLATSEMTAKMVRMYQDAKKTAKLAAGKMPVLFTPEAMSLLWMSIALGVNGKAEQKKTTPLLGRLGEKMLDPRITVSDDPLLPYGLASAPFDDEGVCGAKLDLFHQGGFKNFIYDLQTAGILGKRSTGHGRRSFGAQPSPQVSNLVIAGGKTKLAQMIRNMDSGLIVYDLLGAGQSNIMAGDFSVNIGLGYKVEQGKIVGRVKDAMIAGNVYDLLKNKVLEISSETEAMGSYGISTNTPAMLFDGMNVAAK